MLLIQSRILCIFCNNILIFFVDFNLSYLNVYRIQNISRKTLQKFPDLQNFFYFAFLFCCFFIIFISQKFRFNLQNVKWKVMIRTLASDKFSLSVSSFQVLVSFYISLKQLMLTEEAIVDLQPPLNISVNFRWTHLLKLTISCFWNYISTAVLIKQ